jgi:hypothetical protein
MYGSEESTHSDDALIVTIRNATSATQR